MKSNSAAFDSVERLVGPKSISTDPSDLLAYGTDTSFTAGNAGAVVFPRTSQMVAEILKLCNELNLPVVPSGGRTGLVGGATALDHSLVLSLDKLKHLGPVDAAAATVCVGAGVTTQEVHQHCEIHDLTWPIDLASRGTSQIGGNISTNAGGIHVIRYGTTRTWVMGLQVATMKGELLQMNRALVKNNTNWDLMQLFIGSEGTLGIITDATLRLTPRPKEFATLFLAFEGISEMMQLLEVARQAPFTLHAFEFLDHVCLERASTFLKVASPLSEKASYYVVLEFDVGQSSESVTDWLTSLNVDGLIGGTVAQNKTQRANIWHLREGLAEALYALGKGKSHDVSVSLPQTAAFVSALRSKVQKLHPNWEFYLFGHVGDGNVHTHLVVPKDMGPSEALRLTTEYDALVFEMVSQFSGSISAEHGIGIEKRDHLYLSRTPEELAIFAQIKGIFDPKNLLNRGKVLPLLER